MVEKREREKEKKKTATRATATGEYGSKPRATILRKRAARERLKSLSPSHANSNRPFRLAVMVAKRERETAHVPKAQLSCAQQQEAARATECSRARACAYKCRAKSHHTHSRTRKNHAERRKARVNFSKEAMFFSQKFFFTKKIFEQKIEREYF